MVFIHISKELYLTCIEECKNYLHEHISLTKWDESLTHLDLCKKLDTTWKHVDQWKAISLGKAFYDHPHTI